MFSIGSSVSYREFARVVPVFFYNHNKTINNENDFLKNSITEWNKHRSIENLTIDEKEIIIVANCSHPAIQKSILEFCNYIDFELQNSNNIL